MILKKLKIKNFRQFSGEQEIEFSCDKVKNITVVHGENGSGKTTLLNAITWCLYGETSHDFEESEFLISKKIIADSKDKDILECKVELTFIDSKIEYEVIRSIEFISLGSTINPKKSKETFELFHKKDSQRKKFDNPAVIISRIIPKEMHRYFFFNGERIDKLAMRSNSSEIRDAIKLLLGVSILERAIEHLKLAKKKISKELTEGNQVNNQSKELLSKLDALNDELTLKISYLEQSKKNVDELRTDQATISEKLRGFEETKEIEEKRNILAEEEIEINKSLESINKAIKKFITRKSCFSFMGKSLEDVDAIFKTLKTSNILPNNVKEDFIKRLLKEQKCICDRALDEGHEHYKAVAKLLEFSISKDIDQNISIMKSNLMSINEKMNSNPDELKGLLSERSKYSQKHEKVTRQLDEVKKILKGIENREDISALNLRFEQNDDKISDEQKKQGKLESEIESLKPKINELEKAKRNINQKDHQTNKLLSSLEFSESLLQFTEKVYDERIIEIRSRLSSKINKLFRSICKKDYFIKMDNDFRIDVMDSDKENARPVGKSTGENQITSLSFVGSILEFAKEINEDQEKYGTIISKYGGLYPLVMDSPFGSLDKTYSKNIAESLPNLAEQVVLMVSSSQWRDEVKNGMTDKIGKQYVLCNHSPKSDTQGHLKINYNNKDFPLSKFVEGAEYTEVEELR